MERFCISSVPNGLENSIFQIGKLLTTSLIAGFGMAATTANAVTGSIASFQQIPTNAIGVAMIDLTVHRRRRNRAGIILSEKNDESSICLYDPVGNSHDYFCKADLRNLSFESGDNENNCFSVMLQLCMLYAGASVVPLHSQCTSRCGDVRFTMIVAIASMWLCRVGMAYILGQGLGLGVIGVWIAMTMDWVVQAFCSLTGYVRENG